MPSRKRALSEPFRDANGHPFYGENWRKFVYSPLDVKNREIRVLVLHPSQYFHDDLEGFLWIGDLRDAAFVAVSYVWGKPNETGYMTINGIRVKISRNADHALRYARSFDPTRCMRVWIDAVCINQSDMHERNQQVKLMRDIYSRALCVTLWMGEQEQRLCQALRKMSEWSDIAERYFRPDLREWASNIPPLEIINPQDGHLVNEFLLAEVWHRVWIVQEISLGIRNKQLYLWLGKSTISWERLLGAYAYYLSASTWNEKKGAVLLYIPERIHNAITRVTASLNFAFALFERIYFRRQRCLGPSLDPSDLINVNAYTEATDPRDRVYGLLGLFSDLPLEPDYNCSIEAVYEDAMYTLLQHDQSLHLLLGCNSPGAGNRSMPSWVIDWRNANEVRTQMSRWTPADLAASLYCACGSQPAFLERGVGEIGVLGKTIFVIDQVMQLGPVANWPYPSYPEGNEKYEEVESWLSDAHKFYSTACQSTLPQRHRHESDIEEDIKRTLMLDRHRINSGWTASSEQRIGHWEVRKGANIPGFEVLDYLFSRSNPIHVPGSKQPSRSLDLQKLLKSFLFDLRRRLYELRCSVSPSGQLCLVPKSAQIGDSINVLCGGSVPFLLRPLARSGSDRFNILGAAYVHNGMDGEFVLDSSERLSTGDPDAYNRAFTRKIWLK